eukprot:365672-Chlamydomonas_euryale.AAC.17
MLHARLWSAVGSPAKQKNLCRAQAKDMLGLQRALKRPAFEYYDDEDVMELIAKAGIAGSGGASTSMR